MPQKNILSVKFCVFLIQNSEISEIATDAPKQ
jgi:hypothetical protein